MSVLLTLLVTASILGILIIAINFGIKSKKWKTVIFVISILLLTIVILKIGFNFPSFKNELTARGKEENEVYYLLTLYFFMVVGMVCQHFYQRFSKPKEQRMKYPFDWGAIIAPICASPIIFIPLFAALQNAQVDLHGFSQSSIMIYFVAFENGFLWKEAMAQKLKMTKGKQ